jgi:hypothetical protein
LASIWKRLWMDLAEAATGSVTGPRVAEDSILPRYLKPAPHS